MSKLSHLNAAGQAHMVDVAEKADTLREAVARAEVAMRAETAALIQAGGLPKGDVLATARIGGIMGAKRTPDLIPLCHPIAITSAEVTLDWDAGHRRFLTEPSARTGRKTGGET